jgi:plasmid stabilization system protein ParE
LTAPRIEPEAQAEIREAARWYGEQEIGLSRGLLDEIETMLEAIAAMPRRFALVTGFDLSVEMRRALLKRFPYAIVFVLTADQILVVAVMHVRRAPGYWLYRLDWLEDD